jgi:hypothetical protein
VGVGNKMKKIDFKRILIGLAIFLFACTQEYQGKLIPMQDNVSGKWGYADTLGKTVIAPVWDSADEFFGELAAVSIGGKYGFINKEATEVIPLKYDAVGAFSDSLALVSSNGKYGFVDLTGAEVVALQYDKVEPFIDGLSKVILKSKAGIIDKAGKLVMPFEYLSEQDYSGAILFDKAKNVAMKLTLSTNLQQVTMLTLKIGELSLLPEFFDTKRQQSKKESIFRYLKNTNARSNFKIEAMQTTGGGTINVMARDENGYPIITDTQLSDGGFETTAAIDVIDGKITLNDRPLICDLTVTDACIYGTVKLEMNGCGTKSTYVVFKNTTTPQDIPENILKR